MVRHLCFINNEDDDALANIVLCDKSMAFFSCTLDEDVGITIVTTFWLILDQDTRVSSYLMWVCP